VAVAVLALMGAGVVAKMSSQPVASDSALGDARHSQGVVGSVGQGGISNVMVMTDDGHLGEQSCLFEVTVGDWPRGVCLRYKLGLDVIREWKLPDVTLPRGIKVDPPHANFGRISGSHERWSLGTTSARCVGWSQRLAAREANVAMWCCRPLLMRTQFPLARVKASCRALKSPAEPGMAINRNQSWPR
jgi:hypothetical protein